jgi:hypothetical protein
MKQETTIKFNGNVIEFYTNARNQVCGRYSSIITKGKNKGSKKVLQNYFFQNEESRNTWAETIIKKDNEFKQMVADEKQAKKDAMNNIENPFKVGDLFYHSWGWEQTNIDFYQIIEVKGKTVILKSIRQAIVAGSEGFMSERVTPVQDGFFAEGEHWNKTITKRIKARVYPNRPVEYYIGDLLQYTHGASGVYQSHYA